MSDDLYSECYEEYYGEDDDKLLHFICRECGVELTPQEDGICKTCLHLKICLDSGCICPGCQEYKSCDRCWKCASGERITKCESYISKESE